MDSRETFVHIHVHPMQRSRMASGFTCRKFEYEKVDYLILKDTSSAPYFSMDIFMSFSDAYRKNEQQFDCHTCCPRTKTDLVWIRFHNHQKKLRDALSCKGCSRVPFKRRIASEYIGRVSFVFTFGISVIVKTIDYFGFGNRDNHIRCSVRNFFRFF